jgi:hypothetical protein
MVLYVSSGAQPGDEARVTGTLATTASGCIGLADAEGVVRVVVWPEDSTLTNDGSIHVPELGHFELGDRLEGTGGYYTSDQSLNRIADECEAIEEVIRVR